MISLVKGERFKDARLVHNQHGKQTMSEVAAATGVGKSIIQSLEDDNSNRSVGYDNIAKLASYYHVSSDYLLGLTDNPFPERSAVDDLGLSYKVVEKILTLKNKTCSDCDTLEKFNRLLENDNIWTLLFLIHDFITANKVESMYSKLIEKYGGNTDTIAKELLALAEQYYETDIDLYDFLLAKANSFSDNPMVVRLGMEERSLTELIYLRIDRHLHTTLSEIERGDTDGND